MRNTAKVIKGGGVLQSYEKKCQLETGECLKILQN